MLLLVVVVARGRPLQVGPPNCVRAVSWKTNCFFPFYHILLQFSVRFVDLKKLSTYQTHLVKITL